MIFILSVILTVLLLRFCSGWFRGHKVLCYVLCAFLSAAAVPLHLWEAGAKNSWLLIFSGLLTKGGLALGFFAAIMFAGAVPDQSWLRKCVMPMRGQLSVMASLLACGHMVSFGTVHFGRLFSSVSDLRPGTLAATIFSLLIVLLLVPLFLTSLSFIRKRMKGRTWKKIQRFAYLFYGLLYLHILFFQLPSVREGQWTSILNLVLYSAVFYTYFVMRLTRAALKKGKNDAALSIHIAGSLLLALTVVLCILPGMTGNKSEEAVGMNPAEVQLQKRWEDGTYKGAAIGYNGRLKVSVVIEGGKISEISLKSHVEDEPYVTRAVNGIFPAMIEQNTPDVDAVSTATTTSEAFVAAVHQAIDSVEIPDMEESTKEDG